MVGSAAPAYGRISQPRLDLEIETQNLSKGNQMCDLPLSSFGRSRGSHHSWRCALSLLLFQEANDQGVGRSPAARFPILTLFISENLPEEKRGFLSFLGLSC